MYVSFPHVALLILHPWADNQNVHTYTHVLNQTGKISFSVKAIPSQVTTGNVFLTILSPRFFPVVILQEYEHFISVSPLCYLDMTSEHI